MKFQIAGKTNTSAGGAQRCTASDATLDDMCRLRGRSFPQKGTYVTFPALEKRHRFSLKISFATPNQNGLLLYNGRYNDKNDFIAIEIVDGHLVFSFSTGGDYATAVTAIKVRESIARLRRCVASSGSGTPYQRGRYPICFLPNFTFFSSPGSMMAIGIRLLFPITNEAFHWLSTAAIPSSPRDLVTTTTTRYSQELAMRR